MPDKFNSAKRTHPLKEMANHCRDTILKEKQSTMHNLKITKGKWYANGPKISEVAAGQTYFSIQSKEPFVRNKTYVIPGFYYPHSALSAEEMQAHADLIAEAGTVTNECGYTPRQLLEQRNELLEALRPLKKMAEAIIENSNAYALFEKDAILYQYNDAVITYKDLAVAVKATQNATAQPKKEHI